MLLSRANLQVLDVVLRDKADLVLHQIRVEPDGSTVASDGHVLMAVSPVTERPPAFPEFPGEAEAENQIQTEGGIGINPEVTAKARRDIPRGALGLELGFAAITGCGPGRQNSVELTTTDLNRHLKVEGKKGKRAFYDWKTPLAEGRLGAATPEGAQPGGAVGSRGVAGGAGGARRVCVDRRALVKLLQAIDAAAPDPENAVFIEIPPGEGAGLVLRARNAATGQSVVGLAMSTNTRGEWLPLSEWEKAVFAVGGNGAATQKRQPKRRGVHGSA